MHRRSYFFPRVLVAIIGCVAWTASGVPVSAAGDPRLGEQWGLSVIRAPEAWGAGTGAGITIAVVDTGVDFGHQDLNVGAKLLPGRNILNPDISAQDDNGHGTHVAGIAAAATGNGVGIAGTAPGASILPVKVLRADGSGRASDVATGIRWAAGEGAGAPRAQVINLSLGSDLPPLAALFGSGLEEAIDYAWSRGVVVVLAAGNSLLFASSSGETPAIVVTATNRRDERPSYASAVGSARWGMAAPGGSSSDNSGGIMSTYRPDSYRYLAGTSMSAPHVAGAAAVLLAQGLSPSQTIDQLLATAKDVGDPGRDPIFGAGRLDLACAVGRCGAAATATTGSASGGSATANPETQPASGTSGPGGPSGAGGTSPGPAGSGAPSGDTGGDAPVSSEGGGTRSTATGPAGARSRTTGSRAAGSNGPAGTAPSVTPSSAPSTVVSGDPAGLGAPGAPGSDAGTEADLGATPTGDPGPRVSLAAGRAVTGERRPSPVLAGAAGGLLLLVAFSGLGLRRRRRPSR